MNILRSLYKERTNLSIFKYFTEQKRTRSDVRHDQIVLIF